MINWIKPPLNADDPNHKYLNNNIRYLLCFKDSNCLIIANWSRKDHYFYSKKKDEITVYEPAYFASMYGINLPIL